MGDQIWKNDMGCG